MYNFDKMFVHRVDLDEPSGKVKIDYKMLFCKFDNKFNNVEIANARTIAVAKELISINVLHMLTMYQFRKSSQQLTNRCDFIIMYPSVHTS